jgi:hypothetical protein
VKEGKPLATAADRGLLCAQTLIAGIAAEVENDQWETLSGTWADIQTVSSPLNKHLKFFKKSARWWRQLKTKKMKKE